MKRRVRAAGAIVVLLLLSCGDPSESGPPQQLTDHPSEDRSPAWSPGGTELLFASERDGDSEIYLVAADGTGLRRITRDPAADRAPAWSPDGRSFVFESDRAGVNGLWIQSLASGELQLVLSDASPELNPDWSPDGEWIAFSSERAGNPELYRIRIEEGQIERLTQNRYRDLWPRYSPDGSSLVFFSRRATEGEFDDLFRIDLESGAVTQITDHPTHHDFTPDFGPTGKRVVASMSDRAVGVRELVIHSLGEPPQRAFVTGYHRVFQPAWSPDGGHIAYAARALEGDAADIYVVAGD